MVRLLLEKGASVDDQSKHGETALHRAAASGHEAMVRLLLEKGASVDDQSKHGETALHRAAAGGHEAVVWLLLEKGAGVDSQNIHSAMGLYGAAARGQKSTTANVFLKRRRTAQNMAHLQKYPDVKPGPVICEIIQEIFLE